MIPFVLGKYAHKVCTRYGVARAHACGMTAIACGPKYANKTHKMWDGPFQTCDVETGFPSTSWREILRLQTHARHNVLLDSLVFTVSFIHMLIFTACPRLLEQGFKLRDGVPDLHR